MRTAIWAVPSKPSEIDASWHDEVAALTHAFEAAISKAEQKEKALGERIDGLGSRIEEFGQKIVGYDSQASTANQNLDSAFNRVEEQYALLEERVEQSNQKALEDFREEVKIVIKKKEQLAAYLMRELEGQRNKAAQIV